jgi:uncharacterized alpha-E superfamily protein
MLMLSRVADSLYWMSRYLERAEHTARVLDVNLHQMLDQSPEASERRWELMLTGLRIFSFPTHVTRDVYSITHAMTFDRASKTSIVAYISSARENARQVREHISTEMWEHLNRLYLRVRRTSMDEIWQVEPHEFFQSIKEGSHLFQGITDSTMTHGEGWQFIQVGRFIERSIAVSSLLDAYFDAYFESQLFASGQSFDHLVWVSLLKSCTAFEAYCKTFGAWIDPKCILDFLVLNAEFPHSVRFSVDMIQIVLQKIAQTTAFRNTAIADRLSGRLRAMLDYIHVDEIMDDTNTVHTYLDNVVRQCTDIHNAIQDIYISYPIDVVLGQ